MNNDVFSEATITIIVTLIGLKIMGWISWPWVVVLIPVWAVLLFALILLMCLIATRYL